MAPTSTLEQLASHIGSFPLHSGRPTVIAISGFSGSGKTTLATRLKNLLAENHKTAEIVCIDSFSTHEWHRNADWDNFDRNRFAHEILEPARANHFPLSYTREPWPGRPTGPTVRVPETSYLIVEGCSLFHPDLLKYYDYKIWADCSLDEATERGMWRDRHVHKDEQDHYWQTIWMPNEKDFYNKYHPNQVADAHVNTSANP